MLLKSILNSSFSHSPDTVPEAILDPNDLESLNKKNIFWDEDTMTGASAPLT